MDRFIRPTSSPRKPRHGAGIAILTVYSILLLLMSTTYLRLVCTILINPGYVPRGPQWYDEHERRIKEKSLEKSREKSGHARRDNTSDNSNPRGFAYSNGPPESGSSTTRPLAVDDTSPDLYDFYGKDVFTCEGNGKPIWCSSCANWKPDRAHHCREIGRCVRKMDHFCPWSVHLPFARTISHLAFLQCRFARVFLKPNFNQKNF